METSLTTVKILMIRLSSLGDVILATSALSGLKARPEFAHRYRPQVHWVVSKEYASLLKGHPLVDKLWEFDRGKGLSGWLSLCGQLWKENFTEVYDLHSTLRSKILRAYFAIRSGFSKRQGASARVIGKQRLRLAGYFALKSFWPQSLRPTPLVSRFSELVGGTGQEKPDLSHLLGSSGVTIPDDFLRFAQSPYLCMMPSSRWDGKKWDVRGYFEVAQKHGLPVVVLGAKQDRESALLVKMLSQANLPHYSGLGAFQLNELGLVLANSVGYVGNDTGLGHLAEAVGGRAVVLFGPTTPEMGFGPWRAESKSVSAHIWCSPCGKDGRFCFRFGDRFACQRKISSGQVLSAMKELR